MLIKLVCPQCGGKMEIDDSNEKAFCQFCGTQLVNVAQKIDITQNVNVSGTVIHQMDRSTEPNLFIDFSSSDPRAVMVITFNNTRMKKVITNGQTASMRLPLGRCIATMDLAGKRYNREITIVEQAPVRINASAFGRREIVIDQPPVPYNQQMDRQFGHSEETTQKVKASWAAIVGFILSFTGYLSFVGIGLAVYDIIKIKDRPHGLSYAAIAIGALYTIILIIYMLATGQLQN